MTLPKIKPPEFRYEVHTYTLCQGWINCWTAADSKDDTHFDSFQTIDEAQSEMDEMDDPEEHRIYDNFTKMYVGYRFTEPSD